MDNNNNNNGLHIFFLPFLAPGHMIPMVDLAKLLSTHNVKCTIITTNANIPLITPSISNYSIQLLTVSFPASIPENLINFPTPDLTPEFKEALNTLKDPFNKLIIDNNPDCIISDVFLPWTADLAFDHGIPRIAFHGSSAFCTVLMGIIGSQKPHENVTDEDGLFLVPEIPNRIELRTSQLPGAATDRDDIIIRMIEAQKRTFGTVLNSFAELEVGYADKLKSKSWFVGPLSYVNRDKNESEARGGRESEIITDCMKWLDNKKTGSVIYVCFGSLGRCTDSQLDEIAHGLNNSNHPFIWVVRNDLSGLPEGIEDKGLIIRGWAPQMAILNHPAIGGFLTHCGWNSCVEGVTAGLPMVTWPQFAEQFFNERLIVDVLQIGVSVGAKVCSGSEEKRTLVKRGDITKAVNEVMVDNERKKKAKEIKIMARKATEEGGSSYLATIRLIEDLTQDKKMMDLEFKI